jgi:hypothetical protein
VADLREQLACPARRAAGRGRASATPSAYSASRSARARFEGQDCVASLGRAEEAAELRVRLELPERAQSTLEYERRLALEELSKERRRREEAERERYRLRNS